jgi:hypothetical protein
MGKTARFLQFSGHAEGEEEGDLDVVGEVGEEREQ